MSEIESLRREVQGAMLRALHDAGLTDAAIGRHVGLAQPTVQRLRTGGLSDTSYQRGKKIEHLYWEMLIGHSKFH